MHYSISDLEKFSGVSVHNIRIWERRYGALSPLRTAGNTRLYDDEQLKRLLCIAGLHHSGYKISRACSLSNADMARLLEKDIDQTRAAENGYEYFITQIINHTLSYNEHDIKRLIDNSFGQNGVADTYRFIIYPLLLRTGLMWLNGKVCPSQEHFLSQIIRQKLFTAIDGCTSKPTPNANKWLLFLPEDELHDIPLLLSSYLLRNAQESVYYLGPQVPLDTLSNAAEAISPQRMLLFMTRARLTTDAQNYLESLSVKFPNSIIYISGNKKVLDSLILPHNIIVLNNLTDFENLLQPATVL